MRALKYLCILFALLLVLAAVTGIQSVSATPAGLTIIRFGTFGRICALAGAFVAAAFAYGLQIRAPVTWKAGFAILALSYLNFVIGSTIALSHTARGKDFPSFWLPVGLSVLGSTAVGVYWGLWWK